jgi:hypothetical protein
MGRQLFKVASALAVVIARVHAAAANAWQTAVADSTDKYRPEAHYMRGPGPKWRAKHAQASSRR